jgi:iron complex outermembrane receptor protein
MKYFRSSSTIAAALGIAAIAALPAHAQQALEEIVVTALKRAESLQDAPATVTAFDAETVEQARIQSMRDYVNLTSNMTLMETQNNAFAFVNIRGLAQIRNVDPTVAVVIDGVLSTTSLAFSQELYDIQQIEVLKGPQGALYGRNATGGAINITTKQPTTDPELYVRGGVGNGDNVQLSGVASGPIGDAVRGRVVVGYKEADGWRDNVATRVNADPYEDLTVAGKLLWDIGERTTLDLRLTLSHTESTGSQFVSNAPNFVTGFPATSSIPAMHGAARARPAGVDHGIGRRSEQHEYQHQATSPAWTTA